MIAVFFAGLAMVLTRFMSTKLSGLSLINPFNMKNYPSLELAISEAKVMKAFVLLGICPCVAMRPDIFQPNNKRIIRDKS